MNAARMHLVHALMSLMPPTRAFAFKRLLLRWAGAELSDNVRIASSARFHVGGRLVIGCGTWIGHQVLVVGGDAAVLIGANVDIAPRVTIVTGTHQLSLSEKAAGAGYSTPVTIEDGAWIGAGATILGGAVVGKSAAVAAGALVRGAVEAHTVVGGVPARALKLNGQGNVEKV